MFLHLLNTHRKQILATLHTQQYDTLDAAEAGRPLNTILSDVFGYISFGCWLFVLMPQLWLNYKRKSSDGLSLGFILMWLAGDFADWYGAYIGRLLLPAILIALYFVITDIVLLAQMFCYRKSDDDIFGIGQLPEGAERPPLLVRRGRRACKFSGPENAKRRLEEYREAEREMLLERGMEEHQISGATTTYGAILLSPSSSDSAVGTGGARSRVAQALLSVREMGTAKTGRAVGMSAAVLAVLLGLGVGTRLALEYYPQRVTDVVSQIFGYISAALFFCAYVPQIAWNFTAQSTEGLSAVMFIFTVLGNVTYCMSILAISTEKDYLIAYAPWLAGAAGTLGFEMLVLWQCYFYSGSDESDDSSAAAADSSGGSGSNNSTDEETEDAESVISRRRRYRRRRRRHNHNPSFGADTSLTLGQARSTLVSKD
ncbi:hypothetical protein H4R20_003334 [Coemansia guatemalensis]|uniref:PQ-loop-domain-containing protein n=1 Tax=Coemansia guatemalensis TaxID=2761395 RepID=A0A9W8HWC5_9FUNG|nr:hypothetical protein H4R20_003334 [Coemansia guatemalensis]